MLSLNFSKYEYECGTDEAGRGCLAGPVTAAAVLQGLTDEQLATALDDLDAYTVASSSPLYIKSISIKILFFIPFEMFLALAQERNQLMLTPTSDPAVKEHRGGLATMHKPRGLEVANTK